MTGLESCILGEPKSQVVAAAARLGPLKRAQETYQVSYNVPLFRQQHCEHC